MFPGCPEHYNAEGTLSKYSRNVACQLRLIKNHEKISFEEHQGPKPFIEYSNNMQDVYKNIEE